MSNRLTKGKALAGAFQADKPGSLLSGIPFSVATTCANDSKFGFPITSVITGVMVKITSLGSAATSNTMNVGLCTALASSSGVPNCLINGMDIGTTGLHTAQASSSSAMTTDTVFSYGNYLISATSGAVTMLRQFPVASSTIGYNLNYQVTTTIATAGYIYPIYYDLQS
jgi:hypothetical protein